MAKKSQTLSIVIPSLNEASHLPLLIADLQRWPDELEICICDACSKDLTLSVSQLAGANTLQITEANRGAQLQHGAYNTKGDWILFLHADSRLPINWPHFIKKIINQSSSENIAWYFTLKVEGKSFALRLMEFSVAIRSHLFKRPYGDQGLLISRKLYQQIGGYRPLYLMEDLDLIRRIPKQNIKGIGIPIYSDDRGWKNINVFTKAIKNARLRSRWIRGESSRILANEYYSSK